MTCQDFLARHSEYMDDLLSPVEMARFEAHISTCATCAHYDRVVRQGVRLLRVSPEIEPSSDFFPRLQHRLYNLEDELRVGARGPGSSAIVSLALAGVLALLAWSPLMRLDQVLLPVAGAGEDWAVSEAGSAVAASRGSTSYPGLATEPRPDPTPRSLSESGVPSSIRPLGGRARGWTTPRLAGEWETAHWLASDPFEGGLSSYEPSLTSPWPAVGEEVWWWSGTPAAGQGIRSANSDPLLAPPALRYYSPLLTGSAPARAAGTQSVRSDRDTLSPSN